MLYIKMKQILVLALYLIYLSSICTTKSSTCIKQTNPSDNIHDSYSYSGPYEKCWIIEVPEESYVRLDLKEIKFNGWPCATVHVKFTGVITNEEYQFCSQHTNRMPITFLNDVRVTYYHNNRNYNGYPTSFKLNYTTGATQSYNCVKQTNPSDNIYDSYSGSGKYEKCWIIEVPEDSYVRLDLKEISFNGWSCSEAHVKFTVTDTKEEYQFCSQHTNRMPITVLNDVRVTYYHYDYNYRYYSTSFKLHYTSESLICAQKNHFRCSENQCIHKYQVCDGVKDCKNGADEASCETGVTAIKGVNVSREIAVTWLKNQTYDSYGWGKNTHRAITALYLSGGATFREGDLKENLMAKQLELTTAVALLRNSSDPISVNELSMFINALSITCHSPRQFYGRDLLKILSERTLTMNSAIPGAYLTLCNANWTFSDVEIRSLLNIVSKHSGYPFHLDIQAMCLMALTCIKDKTNIFYNIENATEIYNATVNKFISSQKHDGSFGNIYTTAMVTQALLSSGQENNKKWNLTSTIEFLMRKMNSTSVDFLSVYFVAPIFNSKTLVDMEVVKCEKPRKEGEDEEISDVINKFGGKIQVKYYLYIGDQKDVIHSIYLRMPENSSAYDVMRVAQVADHKYRFLHTDMSGHVYVYEIAGITNDPEAGKFWLLYTRDSKGNGTLVHYIESPDEVLLSDGDHLVMWYKTAQV